MVDPLALQQSALQHLRWRAEQFLTALPGRLATAGSPLHAVHREAFAGIGGVLSQELFGRRRIGASVGRALVASSQASQLQSARQAARTEANELVQQSRQLVDTVSSVIGPRMSQSLHRLLAEADAAHRADTAARKVLEVVGRLEGWRPTPPLRSVAEPFPEGLRALERELRRSIETRLGSLTPNWWNERVPTEVRTRAERRKSQRERVWPWLNSGEHSLVEYLDFPDYSRVILEPQNWAQTFAAIFLDPEVVRVKLRELEPIRNDIAHSREVTRANRERLRLYSDELILQMT